MKDVVTGKNKEQFEKWYVKGFPKKWKWNVLDLEDALITIPELESMPFEMQTGVYLAYYDSLGEFIEVSMDDDRTWEFIIQCESGWNDGMNFESRDEAYKEAFKKANEIVNNNLK